MIEEKIRFKIKEGKQLEIFNDLLLFKSKTEIAELLINAEEKLNKIDEIIERGYYIINNGATVQFHGKGADLLYDDIQKIINEEE